MANFILPVKRWRKWNLFRKIRNEEAAGKNQLGASPPTPKNGVRLAYYRTVAILPDQAGYKLDDSEEKVITFPMLP